MVMWVLGGSVVATVGLLFPIWIGGHLDRNPSAFSTDRRFGEHHDESRGMPIGALRTVFFGWTVLIAALVICAFSGAEGEPGVALGVVLVFASAVPGALAATLTNYMFAVARGRA